MGSAGLTLARTDPEKIRAAQEAAPPAPQDVQEVVARIDVVQQIYQQALDDVDVFGTQFGPCNRGVHVGEGPIMHLCSALEPSRIARKCPPENL